jgi:tRNA modification GTPase
MAVVAEMVAGALPPPRKATLRELVNDRGELLDRAIVLNFPGPASFTGEDCAELHVHGGKAVVAAVLEHVGRRDGLRAADAGEFTRRAFLNGKLDLTSAEGLADLVSAETELQRRMALVNAEGGQRDLYEGWRKRLLHARALIEAELDFADEADVPGSVAEDVWSDVSAMRQEIVNHIDGYHAGEIIRDGFRVVLLGPPNAGKSSLLNALAQRDVAIVTEIAGTTRDLVEVSLDLHGLKVIVTDTAGLRDSSDTVERIGIERALKAAKAADLVLKLTDGSPDVPGFDLADMGGKALSVATKADIASHRTSEFDHIVSLVDGTGLIALIEDIGQRAKDAVSAASGVLPSRLRQIELLRSCGQHLNLAVETRHELELRAEELRLAADFLGRITGAIDVEDLLGIIFSEFCIGK